MEKIHNKFIKVCVYEHISLIRKGMVKVISDFSRIAHLHEAGSQMQLLELLGNNELDVVVLDLITPERDGVLTCELIVKQYPKVKLLVLSLNSESSVIFSLIELGVHGYLLKSCDVNEIEDAIYSVVDHDYYHNDLVARVLRESVLLKKKAPHGNAYLSLRELEVLKLLCKEYTCCEIADRLSMKEKTVHVHRRNIMIKTRTKNSIALFKFAVRNNMTSLLL